MSQAWMRVRAGLLGLAVCGGVVWAAQESKPSEKQESPGASGAPEKKEEKKRAEPLPGLDELLGLPKKESAEKKAGEGQKGDEKGKVGEEELQRRLTGREMTETFAQAVALMGDTAERLARAGDTGLDTQRIQEEIVRRLDTLIESAKEQQQQQQQQSQSSSQQQQQNPTSQQQQQQQRDESSTSDPQEGLRGGQMKSGALRDSLEAARASWGALPARIREALMQGSGDKYSSLYEALTEEYYRRLAEEGPRQ